MGEGKGVERGGEGGGREIKRGSEVVRSIDRNALKCWYASLVLAVECDAVVFV